MGERSQVMMVTGGAGFIGSAVVRRLLRETPHRVVVVDRLTYAGNLDSLAEAESSPRFRFERMDVCDAGEMGAAFRRHRPDAVLHLAAESHVDRSIDRPGEFVRTNVVGTFTLLEAARRYHAELPGDAKPRFRFLHVSTDEVYGSLGAEGAFDEERAYRPNSPYAATKAGSDHLVRAWHRTYGLPVLTTHSSNNFGPFQFPEKLIPLVILNALEGRPLPVYGRGENVRDWLYVDDHAEALLAVLERGRVGETYGIGGHGGTTNLQVVRTLCRLVDELAPDPRTGPRESLIRFVEDRPGHDLRYATDDRKIRGELGWAPRETLEAGLRRTVRWYLENRRWWERLRTGGHGRERPGLGAAAA